MPKIRLLLPVIFVLIVGIFGSLSEQMHAYAEIRAINKQPSANKDVLLIGLAEHNQSRNYHSKTENDGQDVLLHNEKAGFYSKNNKTNVKLVSYDAAAQWESNTESLSDIPKPMMSFIVDYHAIQNSDHGFMDLTNCKDTSLGIFQLKGKMYENYKKVDDIYSLYSKKNENITFCYDVENGNSNESWRVVDSKEKNIRGISIKDKVGKGCIIVEFSKDRISWNTAVVKTNVFEEGNTNIAFYETDRHDLNKGMYYRVSVAYEMNRKINDKHFLFIDTSDYENKYVVEEYIFYIKTDENPYSVYDDYNGYLSINESFENWCNTFLRDNISEIEKVNTKKENNAVDIELFISPLLFGEKEFVKYRSQLYSLINKINSFDYYCSTIKIKIKTNDEAYKHDEVFGEFVYNYDSGALRIVSSNWPILEKETYELHGFIMIGEYEQDNNLENGKEPIEWAIIDNDNEILTLWSTCVLDKRQFHSQDGYTTWNNCSLRKWLNTDFYNTVFSKAEKMCILKTNLKTSYYDDDYNDRSFMTKDNVYILSREELNVYYLPPRFAYRKNGKAVYYGKANETNYAKCSDYWTRSTVARAACYYNKGNILSRIKTYEYGGIKPVIQVSKNKLMNRKRRAVYMHIDYSDGKYNISKH